MKRIALVAGAVALVGFTLAMPVGNAATSGIPGYMDPNTGAFTAATSEAQLAAAAASVARTGKLVVTVTVEIDSAIPADQQITCTVNIGSSDFPGINNGASGESGVIRSGGTGKCTTTIPYIWIVASAKTMMSVSVTVSTGNFGVDSVSHSANTSFPAFPVPIGTKSLAVAVAL